MSPGNPDTEQYYQCIVSAAARDTKEARPRAGRRWPDDGKARWIGCAANNRRYRFPCICVQPIKQERDKDILQYLIERDIPGIGTTPLDQVTRWFANMETKRLP